MTRVERYADRIYIQAVRNPTINSVNSDELEQEVRRLARQLVLDEDAVVETLEPIRPTTADFVQASELVE